MEVPVAQFRFERPQIDQMLRNSGDRRYPDPLRHLGGHGNPVLGEEIPHVRRHW
jgi:hypothetical protein